MEQQPSSLWRFALACAIFSYLYHWSTQYPANSLLSTVLACFAFGYGIAALLKLYSNFSFLPLWWSLKKPTGIYGTSYKPTVQDAVHFGLQLNNKDGDGIPIAALNGKIFYYHGNSHLTFVASNGAGKSASVSIPIGLSIGKHKSLIFTGKGSELAEILGPYRQDVLGQEVYINDPWGITNQPNYCINPIGDLHEFVEIEDPEALDIATGRVLLLISETKGENKYFDDYARPVLIDTIIHLVEHENSTGELTGNLPHLYKIFSGSDTELKEFLTEMARSEIYSGRISRSAKRLLTLLKTSPKTAMAVIGVITNALSLFDPATRLGQNIICSDFDINRIKKEPITIGACIPPDKINSHGTYMGLLIDMLLSASMRAQSLKPKCVFLLDEFGNLAKSEITSIRPAQYLGRSLGTQLIIFAQDTAIFNRYEEASAFTTQAEVYMAWAVRDTKDSEELSKRSGNISVMTENANMPQSMSGQSTDQYSVGFSEKGIPLYRPDEFLQMPDYTAALFFKQNPPMMVDLVHYQSVKEWCDYAENNPSITLDNVSVRYSLST